MWVGGGTSYPHVVVPRREEDRTERTHEAAQSALQDVGVVRNVTGDEEDVASVSNARCDGFAPGAVLGVVRVQITQRPDARRRRRRRAHAEQDGFFGRRTTSGRVRENKFGFLRLYFRVRMGYNKISLMRTKKGLCRQPSP